MVNTYDPSYFRAVRPEIIFRSLDNQDTYFTFNGFDGHPKDVNVIYCDVDNAIGETGSFNIVVEDTANIINKDHLRNTRVKIRLGKANGELDTFLIGFADIFEINRPGTNYQDYRISGFGTAIQASELLLLIRQASKIDNISQKIKPHGDFAVKNLFRRSLTEKKFRPNNRDKLEDITGWHERNISNNLNTNIGVLNEVLTRPADFWDRLCAIEGANWYIDYTDGDEVFTVKHASELHSGITVKSGDLRTASDDADKTGYIKGSFSVIDDSSTGAGVRTGLYTTTIIDRQTISSSFTNKGSTDLNKRFVAQQLSVQNDQRRITDLAFLLSKKGDPESPKSRLNGFIVVDKDNTPTGTQIAKFNIPLSSIDEKVDTIFVNDVDPKSDNFEGITKVWVGFKDRSGLKGNVEDDPNNTIRWHHDGVFNTVNGTYSAQVNISGESDRDNYQDLSWSVSDKGPKYGYSVMSNIRRLQSRFNLTQSKLLRLKEDVIDSSFLKNPQEVNRFISLNLGVMSKARRTINNLVVSIPNNYLYRPYEYVTFSDGLSDVSQDLQIVRAHYMMSGLPGDPQYGTYHCDLTLNGSFNTLLGTCSCL